MPKPLPKHRVDGTEVYRVRFRNSGKSSCETFFDKRRAQWFCDQIELHGVRFALRALADLEDDHGEVEDDSPTLDTVAREFFAWKADYVRSDVTVAAYEKHYETHISPTLGALPVDTITADDVQAWVELMVKGKIGNTRTKEPRPLSPKTIRGRHSLLHQIMEYAAHPRRAYTATNPCKAHIVLPKRIKGNPKGLMPMQWQALHAALRQLDQGAADLAEFLVSSGWRIGEAIALPVSGVEDYGPNSPMFVSMDQVARKVKGGTVIVEVEGKAQDSMRRTKIDTTAARSVRRRVMGRPHNALVFTRKDGSPWQHHNFRAAIDKAAAVANLPHLSAHWFRHSHVLWHAMNNTPLPELQTRIGHASIDTTLSVYGRMIGDVKDDSLTAFAAMRDATPQLDGSPTSDRDITTGQ